jgi:hypothetical protein
VFFAAVSADCFVAAVSGFFVVLVAPLLVVSLVVDVEVLPAGVLVAVDSDFFVFLSDVVEDAFFVSLSETVEADFFASFVSFAEVVVEVFLVSFSDTVVDSFLVLFSEATEDVFFVPLSEVFVEVEEDFFLC